MDISSGVSSATDSITDRIVTVRGIQVILDRDLAGLYGVETRVLKQAVKRNKKRFPPDFMFSLTGKEADLMVSQNVIPSKMHLGGSLPYAFTEHGVANLSCVLNNAKAIEMNILIMRAFVAMRTFIAKNAEIFARIGSVERRQLAFEIKTEHNFEKVFSGIEDRSIAKKQGIFFDGQVFDAYAFVSDIIRSAKKSILLLDNYVDDSVLTLFSKRCENVFVTIYTKDMDRQLRLDLQRFNAQYPKVIIKEFKRSHDRFLIIDGKAVYHFGASLKDLGKKWFAFSKFDKAAIELLRRLE